MFATIDFRVDDSKETVCFRTEEDAKRFQDLVLTYMRESGAGNGYGAYWLFDLDIALHRKIPPGSTFAVDLKRVMMMLKSVTRVRAASDNPPLVPMSLDCGHGSVAFTFGPLPARQRPTVGDMFRVVGDTLTAEEQDAGQGRVLMDRDNEFVVVRSWDEEFGRIKQEAVWYRVRADKVMKIDDWKKRTDGDAAFIRPPIANVQQLRAVGLKPGDLVHVRVDGPGQVVDGAEFLGELPRGLKIKVPGHKKPVDLDWTDIIDLWPASKTA